jgi:hypothetical protein
MVLGDMIGVLCPAKVSGWDLPSCSNIVPMMAQYAHRATGILMGALLVLFLAPRGLFHECGHEGAHGTGDGPGISAPAHCPACDMVVPPFEQVPVPIAPAFISACVALDAPCAAPVVPGHACAASARGPPTVA